MQCTRKGKRVGGNNKKNGVNDKTRSGDEGNRGTMNAGSTTDPSTAF
jgi:hypothetical protein